MSAHSDHPPLLAKLATKPALRQQALGEQVRGLRERAGLSVRALAARTDFSPSFISQLENALVSPSIHSMETIASALGTTIGGFFAAMGPGEGGLVLRRSDRRRMASSWSLAEIEALGRPSPQRRLEPLLITLAPGGRSGKHPTAHRCEQFALVLLGKVFLRLGPDEHRLATGDSVTLLSDELRLWLNESRARCQILIVSLSSQ